VSSIISTITIIAAPFRKLTAWLVESIPGLRFFGKLSVPSRAAVLMGFFLLIVLGTRLLGKDGADGTYQWIQQSVIGALITIATYWLVYLLQDNTRVQLPGIDEAWKVGIDALAEQQISIRKVPLFVILGAENVAKVRDMMAAVQFGATILPSDEASVPLLWYGNSQAMFLFVTGSSCLSAVCRNRFIGTASHGDLANGDELEGSRTVESEYEGVLNIPAGKSNVAARVRATGSSSAATERPMIRQTAGLAAQGTLDSDSDEAAGQALDSKQYLLSASGFPLQKVSEDVLQHEVKKLQYLCSLIREARDPVCPLNGVLALAPFHVIDSGSPQPAEALRKDLEIVQDELGIRCPITLLVSEMEGVEGFLEFIRRQGIENSRETRIGKGCEVWGDANLTRMDAVAAHSVGALEDLIYKLFQSQESLRRPDNARLVSLLCRARGSFNKAFRTFVQDSLGYDPAVDPERSSTHMLLTGCYFAATGSDEDQRAFIKAVFAKLVENQGELEWAPSIQEEERRYQTLADIFSVAAMLSLVAIAVGFVMLLMKLT
jgi:hypothetical protein